MEHSKSIESLMRSDDENSPRGVRESKVWASGEMSRGSESRRSPSPPPPPPPGNPPPLEQAENNNTKPGLVHQDNEILERLADKVQKQALELMELQDSLDTKNKQLDQLENQMTSIGMRGARDSKGTLLSAHTRKNTYTRQAYQALEARFASATSQIERLTKQNKELRYKISAREKAKNTAEREVYSLKQEIVRLKGELSVPSGLIDVSKSLLSNTETMRSKNTTIVTGGGHRIQKLEDEIQKLQSLVSEEGKRNEKQRVYIKVLESAVKAHASDLGLDETDLVAITDGIVGGVHGDSQGRIRGPEGAGAAILITVESLKEELKRYKEEALVARNALEEKENYLRSEANTGKGLRLQIEVANNQINDLKAKLSKFQGSDDQLIKTIDSLSRERDEMLAYIDSVQKREQALQTDVDSIKSNLDKVREAEQGLMAMLKESQNEVDEKHEEIKSQSMQIEDLKSQCDNLELKIRQRDMDSESLEFQMKTKDESIEELNSIQTELLDTVREKGEKLHQATSIAEELREQLEQANEKVKRFELELQEKSNANEANTNELEELNGLKSLVESSLLDEQAKTAQLETALNAAKQRCDELEETVEQLNDRIQIVDDEKHTIIQSVETLTENVESQRQKLDTLDQLAELLEGQKPLEAGDGVTPERIASIVDPVKRKCEEILPELSSFIESLSAVATSRIQKVSELEGSLSSLERTKSSEVSVVKGELAIAKASVERMEREKRYLYETNQQLVLAAAEAAVPPPPAPASAASAEPGQNKPLVEDLERMEQANASLSRQLSQLEEQLTRTRIEKDALAQVLGEAAHEGCAALRSPLGRPGEAQPDRRGLDESFIRGDPAVDPREGRQDTEVRVRMSRRRGSFDLSEGGEGRDDPLALLREENQVLRREKELLREDRDVAERERDEAFSAVMEYRSVLEGSTRGGRRMTSARGRADSFDSQVVDVVRREPRERWRQGEGQLDEVGNNTRCTIQTGTDSPARVTIRRDGEVDIATNQDDLSKSALMRKANAQAYAYLERANRALKYSSGVTKMDEPRWSERLERTDRIRRGDDARGRPTSPRSLQLQQRLESVRNKLKQSHSVFRK